MNSCWGACSGVALLLSKTETDSFLLNYLKQTYFPEATSEDVAMFYETLSDYTEDEVLLLRSNCREQMLQLLPTFEDTVGVSFETIKALPKNSFFNISLYDSESNCGFFYPFDETEHDTIYTDMYLIWCDKSVLPHKLLSGKSYASIDEIIQEFKDKIASYLPTNFDWTAHIGFYEYCIYA